MLPRARLVALLLIAVGGASVAFAELPTVGPLPRSSRLLKNASRVFEQPASSPCPGGRGADAIFVQQSKLTASDGLPFDSDPVQELMDVFGRLVHVEK